jgi:hypothetical protein
MPMIPLVVAKPIDDQASFERGNYFDDKKPACITGGLCD